MLVVGRVKLRKNETCKILDLHWRTKTTKKSRKFFIVLILYFKVSGSKYYYLPEGKITKVNFIRKKKEDGISTVVL